MLIILIISVESVAIETSVMRFPFNTDGGLILFATVSVGDLAIYYSIGISFAEIDWNLLPIKKIVISNKAGCS